MTRRYQELPEAHDIPILLGDLSHIMQIAHDSAAACVNADPELYYRLTGRVAPEMSGTEEQMRQYQKAAMVMEAPYLTNRQQQVAAGIAALVGFKPQNNYTESSLRKELGAQPKTIRTALSILTGKRDEYTPADAQMSGLPLLADKVHKRQNSYAPTAVLRWLVLQPDEQVPNIFRLVRSSPRFEQINDSL